MTTEKWAKNQNLQQHILSLLQRRLNGR